MCEFVEALKERNLMTLQEKMSDMDLRLFRQLRPIKIKDDFWISIQASGGHSCKPKTTLTDLEGYTHWEFAFLREGEFTRAKDVLPEFLSLAELELYFEETTYSYVPKNLVEELYLALK